MNIKSGCLFGHPALAWQQANAQKLIQTNCRVACSEPTFSQAFLKSTRSAGGLPEARVYQVSAMPNSAAKFQERRIGRVRR